jgi:hypothetical protein
MGWVRIDGKDYCPDHALSAQAQHVAQINPV